MSATFTIDEKNGQAYTRIPLSSERASTFHSDHITINKVAAISEPISIVRDAHTPYLRSTTLPEIGDDYTDEEELEWDTLFSQPHVQVGLDRLAEKAKRQFLAGKEETT